MIFHENCYWRFKGEKIWHYGWATDLHNGLARMGAYNGDRIHGVIVSITEIETKPY